MLISLAVVVFASSIAVFFSDEWTALYKKMIVIPGVKLLVPLIILSIFVEKYQSGGYGVLLWFSAVFSQSVLLLTKLVPFKTGAIPVAKIIYLCLLACLPAWIFWLMARRKGIVDVWSTPYRLGVALWILAAILLTAEI